MVDAQEELLQLRVDASDLASQVEDARAERETQLAKLKSLRTELADEFRKRWPTLRSLPK